MGLRDLCYAKLFVDDIAERLASRVQITSDGLKAYVEAIEGAFGSEVDFAQLIKLYGSEGSNKSPETKYSPGECCGTRTKRISGNPEKAHISTSFSERQNLTMRMRMRRFTRLTNAFSKKLENHEHSIALHFMVYNYVRPHQTLTQRADGRKTTPAMAAGICDHVWTMDDLLAMVERLQESN